MTQSSRSRKRSVNARKTSFIQYSKKLTTYFMLFYCTFMLIIAIGTFMVSINSNASNLLSTIVTANSTLAGAVSVGYFSNSSVEKFANYKYTFKKAMGDDSDTAEG